MGYFSTTLFTLFAPHAEPVLWFAATNELLATFFAVGSLICYILFRLKGKRWLIFSGLSCILAFASKETSLLFPPLIIIYDLIFYQSTKSRLRNWRYFLPTLIVILPWVAFLLFRVPLGNAYSGTVQISVARLAINFVYYILIGVFALPNDFAFLAALPTWWANPVLPIVTFGYSLFVLLAAGWLWYKERVWRQNDRFLKSLLFALVWVIGVMGPIIIIVSERTAFMPSVGMVVMFSVLLMGAWYAVQKRGQWLRGSFLIIIVLHLGLHMQVLRYRSAWFGQSAELSRLVMAQLETQLNDLSPETTIIVADLPDHIGYAFTFRNTFPPANQILKHTFEIIPVLDSELVSMSPQAQRGYINQLKPTPDTPVYWYRQGELVPGPMVLE